MTTATIITDSCQYYAPLVGNDFLLEHNPETGEFMLVTPGEPQHIYIPDINRLFRLHGLIYMALLDLEGANDLPHLTGLEDDDVPF